MATGKMELPMLPAMQCDKGCGECCGIVLCTEKEYQTVKRLARSKGVKPVAQGMTCPFYQQGECQVYEARPRICRLFGHSEKLVCCKGYNTNIPAAQERLFMLDYRPTRLLHEMLGSQGVIALKRDLADSSIQGGRS